MKAHWPGNPGPVSAHKKAPRVLLGTLRRGACGKSDTRKRDPNETE